MPSYYLNQCWNIVNWTPRKKRQWNFYLNSYIFIQENVFENIVWKIAVILSRLQCAKEKDTTALVSTEMAHIISLHDHWISQQNQVNWMNLAVPHKGILVSHLNFMVWDPWPCWESHSSWILQDSHLNGLFAGTLFILNQTKNSKNVFQSQLDMIWYYCRTRIYQMLNRKVTLNLTDEILNGNINQILWTCIWWGTVRNLMSQTNRKSILYILYKSYLTSKVWGIMTEDVLITLTVNINMADI